MVGSKFAKKGKTFNLIRQASQLKRKAVSAHAMNDYQLVITLFIIFILIGLLSPILSVFVILSKRRSKKLLLISSCYLIVLFLFIYSPMELYNRVTGTLLVFTLFPAYCIIWGSIFKFNFHKLLKIPTIILTAIPILLIVFGTIFNMAMLMMVVIVINDEINLKSRVYLENKYFIEESNWGWVSTGGKEFRTYKNVIPKVLKYEIDKWNENTMNYGSPTIDTTNWKQTNTIRIIDGDVIHTIELK